MKNLSRAIVTFVLLSLTLPVQAAKPLEVVINEIAWMGTEVSYNDEWIELYNNTDSLINLDGWFIFHFTQKGEQGSTFDLTGTIPAHGFYLLERTDDNSVPNITADKIYTGPLNNNGELLQLSDEQGTIVDLINCIDDGWFAGDNKTKQTMERISPNFLGLKPENWQTSQNPGGTPKAKNSITIISQTKEPTPEPQPKLEEAPEVQPLQTEVIYPSGIAINEILPDPEGVSDTEGEYIEIFNKNSFEVDLSGWKITDTIGKPNLYIFPKGKIINPEGFLVLFWPETKITLNNLDGDSFKLIQPDGTVIDEVNYEKAIKGQSYNRTESGWVWGSTLTPSLENIVPSPISEVQKAKPSEKVVKEPTPEKATEEHSAEKALAAVGKQVPKSSQSLFIFLIALAIAISSGIIILILKWKLKSLISKEK